MSRTSLKPGFTLIELLVVISIMSLLIALLMPALSSARDAAKVSQGLSNLRQISFGLQNYAGSYKSYLPYARSGPDASNGLPYGAGQLCYLGFIENPAVFFPPIRDSGWIGTGAWSTWDYTVKNPHSSNIFERSGFGFNEYIMPDRWGYPNRTTWNMDKSYAPHSDALGVPAVPSRVATMSEFYYTTTDPTKYGWYIGPETNSYLWPNVGKKVSMSFLDGSARVVEPEMANFNTATNSWALTFIVVSRRAPWFNGAQ